MSQKRKCLPQSQTKRTLIQKQAYMLKFKKKRKRKFINNLITDDNQFEVKASVTLNMDGVPHFNG